MAIFSYDENQNLIVPDVYLQRQNLTDITLLKVFDLEIVENSNDVNTVSFTVYQKDNLYYDMLKTMQLIYIPQHGHFVINVNIVSDGTERLEVSGKSWEFELSQKYLQGFQANTAEEGDATDANGEFIQTIFFNEQDQSRSLLHRVLKDTGWSIKRKYNTQDYIKMSAEVRIYDIDWQDVYSFLMDLQNELDVVFIFDPDKREITWCLLEDYGKDTGIYASLENIAKEISVSQDDSKIFTEIVVSGGDGIDVNQVIPAATNSLFKPDYYMSTIFVSQDTIDAWGYYKKYYDSVKDSYVQHLKSADNWNSKLLKYTNATPLSQTETEGTNEGTIIELDGMDSAKLDSTFRWNDDSEYNYGYVYLKNIKESYEEAKAAREEAGDKTSDTYNQYLLIIGKADYYLTLLDAKISECTKQRNEDESAAAAIKQDCDLRVQFRRYFYSIGKSGAELDLLTESAYQEINRFRIPTEYTNDNYIATDRETYDYSSILEHTQELLDRAEAELNKYCVPYITWSCDLLDITRIDEFKPLIQKNGFHAGDFIWLELHEGFTTQVRITSFTYSYSNSGDFKVEFADRIETDTVLDDIAESIGAASSVSSQMEYYAKQMEKIDNTYKNVRKVLDYGLDLSRTSIFNNTNQTMILDGYGLLGRKMITDGVYSPEQIRIQANQIVFTDDNWKTIRAAVGKIAKRTENGIEYSYGVIADTLMVDDLYSINADIGGWKIDYNGLASKNFSVSADGKVESGIFLGSDGTFLTPYLQMNKDSFSLDVGGLSIKSGEEEKNWTDYMSDISGDIKNDVIGSIDTGSIKLSSTGETMFTEKDNKVTPESITIVATCKNGITVDRWLIDGTVNTSFVAKVKLSITIPASYMADKNSILVRAENSNGNTFDTFSISKIKNEISTLLRIESSRGTVFKNNAVSTVLSVVIYHGSKRIIDSETMKDIFGAGAYLQWTWQRLDDESYGVISSGDSRLSNNGFSFSLTPEDVDIKVTFKCELII